MVNYKTVAATDRIRGSTYRSIGRRDATVAINMYLQAKQDISEETLKRSTLLGYCRASRRGADLAGSSPLLVFVLSQMAETIVYVNPSLSLVETDRLKGRTILSPTRQS